MMLTMFCYTILEIDTVIKMNYYQNISKPLDKSVNLIMHSLSNIYVSQNQIPKFT